MINNAIDKFASNWFLHLFLPAVIIALIYGNYIVWFKHWGERHYEKFRYTFPFSITASFGKTFYVIYFKIAVTLALILSILGYISFLMS